MIQVLGIAEDESFARMTVTSRNQPFEIIVAEELDFNGIPRFGMWVRPMLAMFDTHAEALESAKAMIGRLTARDELVEVPVIGTVETC